MRRIIVVTEKKKIDQKWLAKLQVLFPECQIKIHPEASGNEAYRMQSNQTKNSSNKKKHCKVI